MDDVYRLRAEDRDEIDDETRRLETPPAGNGKLLVKTVADGGVYPANDADHINVYFLAEIQSILGTTLTATGSKLLVYNCGRKWPPQGTLIDATEVAYAWVIRYEG